MAKSKLTTQQREFFKNLFPAPEDITQYGYTVGPRASRAMHATRNMTALPGTETWLEKARINPQEWESALAQAQVGQERISGLFSLPSESPQEQVVPEQTEVAPVEEQRTALREAIDQGFFNEPGIEQAAEQLGLSDYLAQAMQGEIQARETAQRTTIHESGPERPERESTPEEEAAREVLGEEGTPTGAEDFAGTPIGDYLRSLYYPSGAGEQEPPTATVAQTGRGQRPLPAQEPGTFTYQPYVPPEGTEDIVTAEEALEIEGEYFGDPEPPEVRDFKNLPNWAQEILWAPHGVVLHEGKPVLDEPPEGVEPSGSLMKQVKTFVQGAESGVVPTEEGKLMEAPDVTWQHFVGAEKGEQKQLIGKALALKKATKEKTPAEFRQWLRMKKAAAEGDDKLYRKARKWGDFYRRPTLRAFGFGEGPAQDPLVRLQQQLTRQYQEQTLAEEGGFEEMLRSREQAVETAMGEQAAGMGVQGAYGGVAEESERARGALARAAQAAYAPARWQEQQKITQQMNQLLNAIVRARLGQGQAIRTAGFSV